MKTRVISQCCFIVIIVLFVTITFGCSTISEMTKSDVSEQETKKNTVQKQPQTSEPETVIPSSSPLSKISKGMGTKEVTDILGQPDDKEMHLTGKRFIPFYFGTDHVRQRWYYKKIGWLEFGGNDRVLHIRYDPTEDGYR